MDPTPPVPWRKPRPLPDPVTETAHLTVRWYRREDAAALHEAIEASRAALLPFLPWAASSHRNPIQSRDFIDTVARARQTVDADDFVMGIFERGGGALVGGTGFHRIDPQTATGEIGYWVRADRRRRGYAAEATAALLTAGFGPWGFRRLTIRSAAVNDASIGVIERIGARLESVERRARWLDGLGWVDDLGYALLAEEWDAARRRGPGGGVVRA